MKTQSLMDTSMGLAFVNGDKKLEDSLPHIAVNTLDAGNNVLSDNNVGALFAEKSWHFCGTTNKGKVFFQVAPADQENSSRCDIEKAVALSRWEPVIQYLENQLDCQIDVKPEKRATVKHCVHIQFDDEADRYKAEGCDQLHVFIPMALLTDSNVIAELSIKRYGVKWHDLDYLLLLEQFFIANPKVEKIEPGAVILLPAAFAANWRGQLYLGADAVELKTGDHKIACEIFAQNHSVHLLGDEQKNNGPQWNASNFIDAQENEGADGKASVKVFLRKPVRIPANVIVGLYEKSEVERGHGRNPDAERTFGLSSSFDEVDILINGVMYCSGAIVPVADGMGVYVHRLSNSTR